MNMGCINLKDFINISSAQHFCVVCGAGGILEGRVEHGARIRERGREEWAVSPWFWRREGKRKNREADRGGKCVARVKEQVGVCEGCLATPGLGNVSPEMTNILSLAGSCEKEGFTCSVLLLSAMSVPRFICHVCMWIP